MGGWRRCGIRIRGTPARKTTAEFIIAAAARGEKETQHILYMTSRRVHNQCPILCYTIGEGTHVNIMAVADLVIIHE